MKRIIIQKTEGVDIDSVLTSTPVFAKKDGKLEGMIVYEKAGWILRLGGSFGSYGHKDTLKDCVEYGINKFDYEFFIEDYPKT